MLVADLMTRDVVTTHVDNTVSDVAKIMGERKLGLLVVVDKDLGKSILGVISDSDIIKKVVATGRNPMQLLVQDIMTTGVITTKEDATVSDAANIMRTYSLKRLPVVQGGRLIGIISTTDIVRSMVEVKKALLDLALKF